MPERVSESAGEQKQLQAKVERSEASEIEQPRIAIRELRRRSPLGTPLTLHRLPSVALRQQMVQNLGNRYGNRYVQRYLAGPPSLIQRQASPQQAAIPENKIGFVREERSVICAPRRTSMRRRSPP